MNKFCFKSLLPLFFALSVHIVNAELNLIPLGIYGGVETNNMTALLLKDDSQEHYLALDAGTVAPGISVALQKGAVHVDENISNKTAYVFRNKIDSYWISHAHLDHLAGLITLSPEDSTKNIYGINSTIEALNKDYFNWDAWPNMTNEGQVPLNQYQLHNVATMDSFEIGKTTLKGIALPLDHGFNPVTQKNYPSSALLVTNSNHETVVFFGDTGPDKEQNSTKLNDVWMYLSTYIKNKQIKAIIIECSYTNSRKASELYGHLNPTTLLQELKKLEDYSGGKGSLNDLTVFIIHAKPSADKTGAENYSIIMDELNKENTFGIKFIQPEQGKLYTLK